MEGEWCLTILAPGAKYVYIITALDKLLLKNNSITLVVTLHKSNPITLKLLYCITSKVTRLKMKFIS